MVHVDTVLTPPVSEDVVKKYGFGEFNIVSAEDGVKGLKPFASWILTPHVEFVTWAAEGTVAASDPLKIIDPQTWQHGDYYICKVAKADPVVVHAAGEEEEAKRHFAELQLASTGLKGYVIFRVIAGSPGGMKQCPMCHTFTHLDSEKCETCEHVFLVPSAE